MTAIAVAGALLLGARSLHFLRTLPPEPETELGDRLAALAPPHTLVAVRARAERYNTEWHTANNFQDPRVFYLARARGWVLPNDLAGAEALADAGARGARFYVHVRQRPIDGELAAWLAHHATRVVACDAGEIYALSRTQ